MYFSTLCVPHAQRLAAWQDALLGSCGAISTDPGRPEFEGSLDIRSTENFGLVRMTHTAREAHRGERDIVASGGDRVFFALQIAGRSQIEHAGRALCLNPGELTIMDGARPLTARFDRKNIQLLLYMARADLAVLNSSWEDRLLRPVPGKFGPLLGTFIQSAFEYVGDGDASAEAAVYQAMLPLLRGALMPTEDDYATAILEKHGRTNRVMVLINQYIGSRIADESLSPSIIAEAFHMSERQLHRIFAVSGQSVGRVIRRTRLDRCACELRNPAHRGRSITDIAFSWGFNDAAHFSRQFRAEFDQSPTEYRVDALRLH